MNHEDIEDLIAQAKQESATNQETNQREHADLADEAIRRIQTLNTTVDTHSATIKDLNATIRDLKAALHELESRVDGLQLVIKEANATVDSLEQEKGSLQQDIDPNNTNYTSEHNKVIQDLVSEKQNSANLAKQLEQEKSLRMKAESQLADQKNQLVDQKNEIGAQKTQLADQKSQLVDQQNEIAVQKSEIADQTNEIALQKNKIADQKSQFAAQKKQLAEETQCNSYLRAEYVKANQLISELEQASWDLLEYEHLRFLLPDPSELPRPVITRLLAKVQARTKESYIDLRGLRLPTL